MADIQSATAEIRRGKKEEERRNHRMKNNGLPYSIVQPTRYVKKLQFIHTVNGDG